MKTTIFILICVTLIFSGCLTLPQQSTNAGNEAIPQRQPASTRQSAGGLIRLPGDFAVPASYDIAYSFRTNTPHPLMTSIPRNIDNLRVSNPAEYIAQIARIINTNSRNDFERFKMAHDFVAITIRYDAESFLSGRIPNQNYENILRTGLAVCSGYANLLKKICDELQIACIIVNGYARGAGTSVSGTERVTESNHAWNIVTINGANYLVDSTWNSGFLEGRAWRQQYRTDYLFLKPEHLIYSHFPTNPQHQLLSPPLSASQFMELPHFRPPFFDTASNLSVNLQRIMRASNSFSFEYTVKDGHRFSFRITDNRNGNVLQNRSLIQQNGLRHTVHFNFPAAGQYKIDIFYWLPGADRGIGCGDFIVQASAGSRFEFPRTFSSSGQNVNIISPLESPLIRGRTY